MNEIKTSIKRLLLFYLLLAVNIIPNNDIIPCRFPLENISSLYLLALTICMFLYYYLRVAQHYMLRRLMLSLAFMEILLIVLRGIKYSVFGSVFFLARYSWYLFFIPMLFIPVLLFYISLYVNVKDEQRIRKRWGWVRTVTVILILLVLTNDLHQMVYQFNPGFENWDRDYSHGWVFAAVTAWEYGFYIVAIIVLVAKCRVTKVRNQAWLILIPFLLGVIIIVLKFTDMMPKINGISATQYPEALCCMVAGVLECCMQLGLIPTNENYKGLMKKTSIPVQITDFDGNVIYKSDAAQELTEEQFSAPDNSRTGEHTILRRMDIPGGYGFWQNDVTELDRINAELEETGETLADESELIRLQNELKEKQAAIEQRTMVYDMIARNTQRQSLAISRISELALHSADTALKDKYRKHIALLGAYIKRFANLMLLSSESKTVSAGELGISVAEILRYLNMYGVPGELLNTAEGNAPAGEVFAAFEAFELLLECNLEDLRGVFVKLDTQKNRLIFKLTLENMLTRVPESVRGKLTAAGIQTAEEYEDNTGFICLTFPEGGGEE